MRLEAWSSLYGEEEYLRDRGVPVEAEANRTIRELERPVKTFADKHLNSTPTLEEVSSLLPQLQALSEALSRANTDGVHQLQSDHAWGCLAAASNRIARIDRLSCEEAAGTLVEAVLLEGSHHPEPVHDPEGDAQFDEHPSWGSPAARIEAAEGLIILARNPSCAIPDVLKALERLSNDQVPAVRFQIARNLNVLFHTVPSLMWRIIDRVCREEVSRGVLKGLLTGTLQRLVGADPDHITALSQAMLERVLEGPGAAEVRGGCVGILADLYIWRGHPRCGEIILAIATSVSTHRDEALRLSGHLRKPLTHGPTDPSDSEQDAVRLRAMDLLGRLLHSAREGLLESERLHSGAPLKQWPLEDQESAQSLARLADHVGIEVYFASGAYDRREHGQGDDDRPMTRERAARFYREASSILDDLAEIGLPSVTHHLLQTLDFFVPVDPRGVFLRVGRVVRAGQRGGYQYEALAADLIVKVIERYLAEHRALLQEDAESRQSLMEILDIFVQAGWPSARQLTYRLDEIFR